MNSRVSLLSIVQHLFFALFVFFTIFYTVWASEGTHNKVIYGPDDRYRIDHLHRSKLNQLSAMTAAMIEWANLEVNEDRVKLQGKSLRTEARVCTSERFAYENTPANCSGFLIAPKLLATAGHCIETYDDCQKYAWVFDFTQSKKELSYKKSLFRCTAIVSRHYDDENDFAVIQLDRSTKRDIIPIRQSGTVSNQANLVVVGHPSGLPQKVAMNAKVRENTHKDYFRANLDTFGGNSGSPVYDMNSGMIEGILVRGETDYTYDRQKQCYVVNRCKDDECEGESVTRATNIIQELPKKNLFTKIRNKQFALFFTFIRHPELINQESPNSGNSPLQEAIMSGNISIARYLLKNSKTNLLHENRFGMTAFEMLAMINQQKLNQRLATLFIDHTQFNSSDFIGNLTPLMHAAHYGNIVLTKALLNKDIDINQQNSRGYSALHIALINNNKLVSRELIRRGADTDLEDQDGWTPFLLAARYASVQELLELQKVGEKDLNQQNEYGHTSLMLSILNEDISSFNYLVNQSDVDLNLQRRNGQTAAHFALQNNEIDKFFTLVEKGCRTDIKDDRKKTVIEMAQQMGRTDIVERITQIQETQKENTDE